MEPAGPAGPKKPAKLSATHGLQAVRMRSRAYFLGGESWLFLISGYYTERFYLRYQGMLVERSLPCRIQ